MSSSASRTVCILAFVAAVCITRASLANIHGAGGDEIHAKSAWLNVVVSPDHSRLVVLGVDGLGGGDVGVNLLAENSAAPGVRPAGWMVAAGDKSIDLTSTWSKTNGSADPFVVEFDQSRCYATLLGRIDKDGRVAMPAVLHLPSRGTFRLTCVQPKTPAAEAPSLEYKTIGKTNPRLVRVSFPSATRDNPTIRYHWEIAEYYPQIPGMEKDSRFDPIRRDWLNILQLSPSRRVLSNHTASDTCAFCYYEYADIARETPALAGNLSALDVVRQTLDFILAGGKAYGMPGFGKGAYTETSADTYPSLLIAARDSSDGTRGQAWLSKNYPGVKMWADSILASEHDGDGLFKYGGTGNSGIWQDNEVKARPANWWDTIGFGHEDAYSNALDYRALRGMAEMAGQVRHPDDAAKYAAAADRLSKVYFDTFYDHATGVLAGWKSADGQLHDYYFPWVNGIAIHNGLVPSDKANALMGRMLAKLSEVGYTRFDLGLPGNLIPVARKDYVHRLLKYGGGAREDNRDGFQIYENGGATACFAYFTIAALYDLGRIDQGDRILFPILHSIGHGDFEGIVNKKSNDWRTWDGQPTGYEGFLSDNYYVLLAVIDRERAISMRARQDALATHG